MKYVGFVANGFNTSTAQTVSLRCTQRHRWLALNTHYRQSHLRLGR